jgi:hypothetical protein
MFPLCECVGIYDFEQDLSLFPHKVLTAEVNTQVEKACGVLITPNLYINLGYRAYFQALYGYLGRVICHPAKACLLEIIRTEWSEPQGASDHIGLYDASQEYVGHRVLIGREVVAVITMDKQNENEADAVD